MKNSKRGSKAEDQLVLKAKTLLSQSPLKMTKSRVAVVVFLLRHHGPFRIEEIHAGAGGKALDLVTVYRTLATLEELGFVNRVNLNDSVARYEMVHEHDHHHHVMCTSCQKIETFHDCVVGRLEKRVEKLGYSKIRHSLEFFGICADCSAPR